MSNPFSLFPENTSDIFNCTQVINSYINQFQGKLVLVFAIGMFMGLFFAAIFKRLFEDAE